MIYWICYKRMNGIVQYIAGTDDSGGFYHTTNEQEATKFVDFNYAMLQFQRGYTVLKRED